MRFISLTAPFSALRFFTAISLLLFITVLPEASFADSPQLNGRSIDTKALSKDQRIVQAISRLTFGSRPGDVERIQKMGVDAFIEGQINPDSIDDTVMLKRLEKLPTLNLTSVSLSEQYNPPKRTPTPVPTLSPTKIADGKPMMNAAPTPEKQMATVADTTVAIVTKPLPTPTPKPLPTPKNPGQVVTELQRAKLLRAVYSERQLYEVMVDFWENHFSIYANKDADRLLMTSFDRDSIRPFSMGRFRDLLGATAHSPAMLFYLDNWQSSLLREYPATKDKPARKSGGINENYARELMELHTLGVDGGYTQKDVQEVARCFTGWTIRKPNEEGTFVFNPSAHDNGEKLVMGTRIAPAGGIADGERVLDILAKSPATAKFIATKMARRLLGDNPSQASIDRAAKAFLASDGSITETLRSIITSPAFFNANAYQTKVKSPFEYVASALRATGAQTDANRPILDWIARMGQPTYGRVTPDGYPDFSREWLSNNDLLSRLNFANALAMNTIKGTTIDTGKLVVNTSDPSKAATELIQGILMGQVSDKTRATLEKLAAAAFKTVPQNVSPIPVVAAKWATGAAKPQNSPNSSSSQLVALALGSPEFQRK